MKIYTLGTSHGDATYCRFNSSTVYETADGSLYLLDAGTPVEALMTRKGLKIQRLRAVFITHMHDDHVSGITNIIKSAVKYPAGREHGLAVFLPEAEALPPLRGWLDALHLKYDHLVTFGTVSDGVLYADNNLRITAIRTRHLTVNGVPSSFAYLLEFHREDISILHTGDLRGDFSDFPKIALEKPLTACLCEATHYKPTDAAPVLAKAKLGRLIFIHIHNPWHGPEGEAALLSHYKSLPYPVDIAHDGDEFEL